MKQLPRRPRYSVKEILWQRLLSGNYKGRPIYWHVRLVCGHEEKLRVRYTRSVDPKELAEFLRSAPRGGKADAFDPTAWIGTKPDFLWVPPKGTEAACRLCPPPSILDQIAVVTA